jgi:hypothetical protein
MLAFAKDLADIVSGKDKDAIRKHLSEIEIKIDKKVAELPKQSPTIRVFALYHNEDVIDTAKDITGPKTTAQEFEVIDRFPTNNLAGFYFGHMMNRPMSGDYTNRYQYHNVSAPSANIIRFALYYEAQVLLIGNQKDPLRAYIPLYSHFNNFVGPPRQDAIGKEYPSRKLTEAIQKNEDPVIVIRPDEWGPTAGFVGVKYKIVK